MIRITEPDVALTDYALAVECALLSLALHLQKTGATRVKAWFLLFFGSAGMAAFCGGTVHGFFLDRETLGHVVFWRATLLSMGLTAIATWAIALWVCRGRGGGALPWLAIPACLDLAAYCLVVLWANPAFFLAMAHFLPAAVFLTAALSLSYRRRRSRWSLLFLGGLLLTFLAAIFQQAGIALPPAGLSHNALAHVIQGLAFPLIFSGARGCFQQYDFSRRLVCSRDANY